MASVCRHRPMLRHSRTTCNAFMSTTCPAGPKAGTPTGKPSIPPHSRFLPIRGRPTADIAADRIGPMANPPHLDELIRESVNGAGWNVTETKARLGCVRGTLSRLLHGRAGVPANTAPALEDIGRGTAEHWMRMRAGHGLAQVHRVQNGA